MKSPQRRATPWRETALLCVLLMVAHQRDYLRGIDGVCGLGQIVVSAALGLGVVVPMVTGLELRQQRGTGLELRQQRGVRLARVLGTALPSLCAALLLALGLKISVATKTELVRLWVSWSLVTAAFEFVVIAPEPSRPMVRRAAFIFGHIALIPSISAADVDLSEGAKVAGFILALLLGIAIPWATAMASQRLVRAEGGGTYGKGDRTDDERQARTSEAERRAAEAKEDAAEATQNAAEATQQVLSLQTELALQRSQFRELQTTCNGLLRSYLAAIDTQDQLCDFVKSTVPQSLWSYDVVRALHQHENDEGSSSADEDAEETQPASAAGDDDTENPMSSVTELASRAGGCDVQGEQRRVAHPKGVPPSRPARSPAPQRKGPISDPQQACASSDGPS